MFDYGPGNTLPLAIFYLVAGTALVVIWLWWLDRKGVSYFWLMVFALFPYRVWLTVNISTDLLFALLFAVFYVAYFRRNGFENRTFRRCGGGFRPIYPPERHNPCFSS